MRTRNFLALAIGLLMIEWLCAVPAPGQVWSPEGACVSCQGGQTYRLVYQTVYDQKEVTAYRIQYETECETREVTSYRPVWETSMRENRYTVSRPVTETAYRDESVHGPATGLGDADSGPQLRPGSLRARDRAA